MPYFYGTLSDIFFLGNSLIEILSRSVISFHLVICNEKKNRREVKGFELNIHFQTLYSHLKAQTW
jgi:hypothetical protein